MKRASSGGWVFENKNAAEERGEQERKENSKGKVRKNRKAKVQKFSATKPVSS